MNSSFENSNSSSFGYSDSSTVDSKFMSPNAPSNGDNGNNDSYANRNGFQTAEALVEDGIKHACQQLTMKLSDIQMSSRRAAEAATRRTDVAAWLNGMFSTVNLTDEPSEEDLRACLSNGSILCQVMNKLNPGSIPKIVSKPGLATTEGAAHSAYQRFENVRNFLVAIDDLRLPTFEASDLEQGNMVTVVDCLLSLKEFYDSKNRVETQSLWKQGADTGIPNDIKSTVRDSTLAWIQNIGQKFQEALQVKAKRYPDLQAVESSGILNCLDETMLSVINLFLSTFLPIACKMHHPSPF